MTKTNWVKRRVILVSALLAIVMGIGCVSFYRCHDKIGDPHIGFFVLDNLVVGASQRAQWAGIKAGVRPLDQVIEVNGKHFVDGSSLAKYIWSKRHTADTILSITLKRGRHNYTITYPLQRYNLTDFIVLFVAPFVLGVIFITLGAIVFFAQPRLLVTLVYFVFCSLCSTFCFSLFESYSTYLFSRVGLLYPLMGGLALHLFTLFPERLERGWVKPLVTGNYIAAVSLVVLRQALFFREAGGGVLSFASVLYIVLVISAVIACLFFVYWRVPSHRTRDKIKVLGVGFTVLILITGYWTADFLSNQRIFYLDQAVPLFLIFPVFLAYAILKRNIFDIDRVMRAGLVYGVLSAGVMAVYLTATTLIGEFIPQTSFGKSPYFFLFLVIIAAFVFVNFSGTLQHAVMRLIFPGRYNIISTLEGTTHKLSLATTKEMIHEILVDHLVSTLGLIGGGLITKSEEDVDARWRFEKSMNLDEVGLGQVNWNELSQKIRPLNRVVKLHEIEKKSLVTPDQVRILRRNKIALVVNLDRRKNDSALLLLCQRKGDRIIAEETFDLLNAIARQAAISLENASFYERAADQERLAALGKVASIMIHEIKNPIGIINVSAETIRKRFSAGDTCFELATIIGDEVHRMDKTLEQILKFAKPDQLHRTKFSTHELIDDVVKTLRPSFNKSSVHIDATLAEEEKPVYADREKLRQILYNLLLNAKEALEPSGGEVKIKTEFSPDSVLIFVEDSGKGIPESVRDKIFQPFYSTKAGGTGLGLAIVRQILQEHRGDISIVGSAKAGARFEVSLPLSP